MVCGHASKSVCQVQHHCIMVLQYDAGGANYETILVVNTTLKVMTPGKGCNTVSQ